MTLTFSLTHDEAQVVINALVKEPYLEVFDLISKIQSQASKQMTADNSEHN